MELREISKECAEARALSKALNEEMSKVEEKRRKAKADAASLADVMSLRISGEEPSESGAQFRRIFAVFFLRSKYGPKYAYFNAGGYIFNETFWHDAAAGCRRCLVLHVLLLASSAARAAAATPLLLLSISSISS